MMLFLRSKSVRTRMTLWLVLVLAAVLAVYIAIVFSFQYVLLTNQIFHDEVQDVETVEGLFRFDDQGRLALRDDFHTKPQSRLLTDRLMEVRSLSGQVLYRSETLQGAALGGPIFDDEGTESFNRRIVRTDRGVSVLLISHQHPVRGRMLLIRLGYSLTPLWNRMTVFFGLLILALPITLLLAGYASYRTAKRVLLPLNNMASRTEQITANNLQDRLHLENEHDELGHMGRVVNHLLERLEQSFEQLQRFTADAAHELRAPLSAIRAVGEAALAHRVPQGVHREAISSMLEENYRLSQTVESLLLLARADARHTIAEKSEFTLLELVDEVVDLLEALLEERSMKVAQLHRDQVAGHIFAERMLIRAALMNVLHNAIKFGPPGSDIVVSYSEETSGSTCMQHVVIQDAGPGVPVKDLDRVFDRFYTGSMAGREKAGAGLGLSIAKLAIERNRGRIRFEENILGAACHIDLPVRIS